MPFWLVFFFWVAATILGELLRPKPKFGAPQPSSLGDFSLPTAIEGRPIPVLWGTCKVKGPNVVWYGDLVTQAITQKVKTGMFSSKKITTGYKYFLGMQMVICHGVVDVVQDMRFDDKPVSANPIRYSRPSGWVNIGTTNFRGQDGGLEPTLHTYINEVTPNFSNYITPGFLGGGVHMNFGTVEPGASPTVSWRVYVRRKVFGSGSTNLFIDILCNGSVVASMIRAPESISGSWTEVKYKLTPLQVLLITNWSQLQMMLHVNTNTLPGEDYYECAFMEIIVESQLGFTTDFDATGQMLMDVKSPTLFGGPEAEGGIEGAFDIYAGTTTQTPNAYLQNFLGVALPAYRGVCYLVARRVYVGTTPYLKPMAITVRRCPNQLGLAGGMENIDGDANPACILYEMLTDLRWGLMIASSKVDSTSFLAAGATLYDEGLGISMVVDSQATGFDLVGEILRHVDGVIYPDPETGKLTLILARNDYTLSSLPTLDDSSIEECRISRPSWAETRNSVKVRYVDRSANYTERIAAAQDLANVQARGGDVAEEQFDFLGLTNAVQAQKAVARVLKTASYPLAGIELTVNRLAFAFRPGSVFKLTWPAQGIVGMVCRVTRVSTGDLTDGRVRVDAVEDIFGVSWTAFTEPAPSSGWVNPVGDPEQLLASRMLEVPYGLVIGPERLLMALGVKAVDSVTIGYEVRSDATGGTGYLLTNDVRQLTPSGLLEGALDYTADTLIVENGPDVTLLVPVSIDEFKAGVNVALIDDEFIAWVTIHDNGDGTSTLEGLVRGVLDTTPKPHAVGARVWFTSQGSGLVAADPYPADLTVNAKLLAYNPNGIVELEDAAAITATTASRAARPYVPRDVTLNGALYPLDIDGALVIAWSHRDRLGDWDYETGGATPALETGSTYTLNLYDETGTLQRTETGLTSTTYTWTAEIADCGLGRLNAQLRVELFSVGADALESFQVYDYTVSRGGFGVGGFGYSFGE